MSISTKRELKAAQDDLEAYLGVLEHNRRVLRHQEIEVQALEEAVEHLQGDIDAYHWVRGGESAPADDPPHEGV